MQKDFVINQCATAGKCNRVYSAPTCYVGIHKERMIAALVRKETRVFQGKMEKKTCAAETLPIRKRSMRGPETRASGNAVAIYHTRAQGRLQARLLGRAA